MDKVYEIIEWIKENWLTSITIAYVVGITLYCHFKGFIHTALGICTAIVSILLTALAGQALDKVLPQYVGGSQTVLLAVKIVCLIVIFVLMRQLMHLIIKASDAVMSLPVLHGIDQIAGAAAGLAFALIFVWLVGAAIALCEDMQWAKPFMQQITASPLLSWLHGHNVILELFKNVRVF